MKFLDQDKVFFTADLHLFHERGAWQFRDFKTIEDMHELIITRWNKVIPKDAHIFILGYISFGKPEETMELLGKLYGKKYLIKGNHDGKRLKPILREYFGWVADLKRIKVRDVDAHDGKYQQIILCHYAMKVWNNSHHGSWHLYGHSHGLLKEEDFSLSLDVGLDANNFYPVCYADIKYRMSLKTFIPIDHHGATE
jgi:calcineurin-like phosphoesterase family protein